MAAASLTTISPFRETLSPASQSGLSTAPHNHKLLASNSLTAKMETGN